MNVIFAVVHWLVVAVLFVGIINTLNGGNSNNAASIARWSVISMVYFAFFLMAHLWRLHDVKFGQAPRQSVLILTF